MNTFRNAKIGNTAEIAAHDYKFFIRKTDAKIIKAD